MKLKLIAGLIAGFFHPGVTNSASGFQSDVEAYIQEEVEPLARRQLVAYQFGKPMPAAEFRKYLDDNFLPGVRLG